MRNGIRLLMIGVAIVLLSGCTKEETPQESISMEQIMMDEGIEYEEILVSAPYDGEYGFAIYFTEDGIGNAQFSTENGQWHYTGSTEFSAEPPTESPIISLGMTHWNMDDATEADRQPVAILAGEVTDQVERIELEFDEEIHEGKIIEGVERNGFYWVGGYRRMYNVKARAYDEDGELVDEW
ncbi:hypothetical protein KP77_31500 [Jeotgalibacillus alimentarius]|uniref:Uncharacterized protein n=1 Tax=Jeotgalibacillus alimentarius TaxID=135826 RepID=A0A0C2RNW8_9BACL|nr:hypothetical protein [Jeotgalibacillus alimentarius]KIL43444.1 hypothetical protein KP77_31500 [Jeotgalibacillus alimentarius]